MNTFGAKVGITYGAAIAVMAVTLIVWYTYENPNYTWRFGEIVFAVFVSFLFGAPVFLFIGLPYLSLAYPAWGQDHEALFVVTGMLLGGLGGGAFGAILAMPLPIPPFMPIAGVTGGATCSVIWHLLSRQRLDENA